MFAPLRVCLVVSLASTSVLAADWFVDTGALAGGNGSVDRPFRSVAQAIAIAGNGDAIRIAPGTYPEHLVVDKDLRLFGARGAQRTCIDAGFLGRVIDVPIPCVLELRDLELVRGAAVHGGGIRAIGSVLRLARVRISDCWFGDTAFGGNGGGILQQGGSLYLDECEIENNTGIGGALDWGGGIGALFARVDIQSSVIASNHAGSGGGISVMGDLAVRGSTIAGNDAQGILQSNGSLTVESSIVWANVGASIQLRQGASASVTWSTVMGGFAGAGNLASDPLFLDGPNGDLRLRAESPCIDAGNPAAALAGVDVTHAPRLLDGDLDGRMQQDQGAFEHAHAVIVTFGAVSPGGTFGIGLIGENGWLGVIYGAASPHELWLAPYGALFFDPGQCAFAMGAGALPFGLAVPVPLEIPRWFEAHFQGVALSPSGLALECSNALVLHAY